MVRPDHQGGTLTLERQLEQLRDNLPPNEQEILGHLLKQVAGLRGSETPRPVSGLGVSEMATGSSEAGRAGMPPDLTNPMAEVLTDEPAAGSGTITVGNEMPTTAGGAAGSDVLPDALNEMPEARLVAAPSLGPAAGEADYRASAQIPEAIAGNEMPGPMPGFGGDYEMPVATSTPY